MRNWIKGLTVVAPLNASNSPQAAQPEGGVA